MPANASARRIFRYLESPVKRLNRIAVKIIGRAANPHCSHHCRNLDCTDTGGSDDRGPANLPSCRGASRRVRIRSAALVQVLLRLQHDPFTSASASSESNLPASRDSLTIIIGYADNLPHLGPLFLTPRTSTQCVPATMSSYSL